jgi:hypothetical protein
MKPNWACSGCGMWSTRKSSVKRHIQSLHNGNASLVAFIDYVVGRQSGIYHPSSSGSSPNSTDPEYQNKGKKTSIEIFEEEFMKEKARLAARKDMGLNF